MGRKYIDAVLFSRLLNIHTPRHRPSLCAICRGWGSQRVCAECMAWFAPPTPRCSRCAINVPAGEPLCGTCLTDPPPFASSVAALNYSHPWDDLITRFKFHAALDLAPTLAALVVSAVREGRAPPPALLVPMPLSRRRLRERGYNQAWELARRIAPAFNCRAEPSLLLRIKDSPHQLALARGERAANVRAAFAVEPLRSHELRGRTVALVDDVMTSGASAAEATRELLQAGATSVQVWVVARTPRPVDR